MTNFLDCPLKLEKFNMSQFFEKSFYPISFYYLGMLTKRDDQYMCLPNLNMGRLGARLDFRLDFPRLRSLIKSPKTGDEALDKIHTNPRTVHGYSSRARFSILKPLGAWQ
jgi:hypothetical protein